MKKTWMLFVFVFLAVVVLYLIWDNYEGRKDQKRRTMFNLVKKGMSEKRVIEILGTPDTIYYSNDSLMEYEYFTKEYSGIGKSGFPTVAFDTNKAVKYIDFGD